MRENHSNRAVCSGHGVINEAGSARCEKGAAAAVEGLDALTAVE